jgi:hypothetical protein
LKSNRYPEHCAGITGSVSPPQNNRYDYERKPEVLEKIPSDSSEISETECRQPRSKKGGGSTAGLPDN